MPLVQSCNTNTTSTRDNPTLIQQTTVRAAKFLWRAPRTSRTTVKPTTAPTKASAEKPAEWASQGTTSVTYASSTCFHHPGSTNESLCTPPLCVCQSSPPLQLAMYLLHTILMLHTPHQGQKKGALDRAWYTLDRRVPLMFCSPAVSLECASALQGFLFRIPFWLSYMPSDVLSV